KSDWSGEVKVSAASTGLLLPQHQIDPVTSTDSHKSAARSIWNAGLGSIYGTWENSAAYVCRHQVPQAPIFSAALNGDQVDISGQSSDNLIPGFFWGHEPWPTGAGSNVPTPEATNGTVAWADENAGWSTYTSRMMRLTATSSSVDMSADFPPVPVIANEDYVAAVYGQINTVSGGALTMYVEVLWYTSTGASISTGSAANQSFNDGANWPVGGTVTAPATAAWAVLRIRAASIADIGDIMDLTHPILRLDDGVSATDHTSYSGGLLWGQWLDQLGGDDPAPSTVEVIASSDVTVYTADTNNPQVGSYDLRLDYSLTPLTVVVLKQHWGPFLPITWPGGTLTLSGIFGCVDFDNGIVLLGIQFLDEQGRNTGSAQWSDGTLVSYSSFQTVTCAGIEVPEGATTCNILIGLSAGPKFLVDALWLGFEPAGDSPSSTILSLVDSYHAGGDYGTPVTSPAAWLGIERSLDGGTTYTTIAMEPLSPSAATTFTDYLCPENWSVKYRACTYALINGVVIQGEYTSVTTLTTSVTTTEGWTLWDPSQDVHIDFDIDATNPQLTYSLLSALNSYSPIGAARRVVTKDTSKGKAFQLLVDSIDDTELALWQQLHEDRNALLLVRLQTGEVWSVILTGDPQVKVLNTDPVRFQMNISLEEIDVPPVW
ncbi:MAG: hypothetical protein ACWGQW_10810, partial [bacterium]